MKSELVCRVQLVPGEPCSDAIRAAVERKGVDLTASQASYGLPSASVRGWINGDFPLLLSEARAICVVAGALELLDSAFRWSKREELVEMFGGGRNGLEAEILAAVEAMATARIALNRVGWESGPTTSEAVDKLGSAAANLLALTEGNHAHKRLAEIERDVRRKWGVSE